MGFRVVVSAHADTDIDEIVSYMTIRLKNPKAARDMIDELRKIYEALAEQPYVFPHPETHFWLRGATGGFR
jgi:plasmid stabilization system protein ParE